MDYSRLPIGDNAPHEVHVVIEIPRGTSNKVEYDTALGVFRLDRALYSPLYYPCEYGFVTGTRFEDGDPLDILVLASQPTFTGCILPARPVALLKMTDENGRDDKVLGVSSHDPRFRQVSDLADVPEHLLEEIHHFFSVYKDLEHKSVELFGWQPAAAAHAIISKYRIAPAPGAHDGPRR